MHAISSYRGNRPTNTQTHRQDQLQYTAPLSLAQCNNNYSISYDDDDNDGDDDNCRHCLCYYFWLL